MNWFPTFTHRISIRTWRRILAANNYDEKLAHACLAVAFHVAAENVAAGHRVVRATRVSPQPPPPPEVPGYTVEESAFDISLDLPPEAFDDWRDGPNEPAESCYVDLAGDPWRGMGSR